MSLARRRPRAVLGGLGALAAVFALLAVLLLDADAGPGTLADRDSAESEATARYHRDFGDEPVIVQVRGRPNGCPGRRDCRLLDLLVTPDWLKVLSLEGCLSGRVPPRARVPAPVCRQFARERPFRSVSGPGTFVNDSVRQVSSRIRSQRSRFGAEARRAADAARRLAQAEGKSPAEQERLARRARELSQLQELDPALRYGLSPQGAAVADPNFVLQLVFDPSIGFDAPKTRFAHIFPTRTSALIRARPRPDLSAGERRRTLELVREALASPSFETASAEYRLAGAPVVRAAVEDHIPESFWRLALVALLFVAGALLAVARAPARLVPLLAPALAIALALGAMALLDVSLTIASIAIVAVLLGLAAGRVAELREQPERHDDRGSAPIYATLAAAAAIAMLVFSPAPMTRSFGAFVAFGMLASLAAGPLILTALDRLAPARWRLPAVPASARRRVGRIATALSQAPRDGAGAAARSWRRARRAAARRPGTTLALALAFAIAGWALEGNIEVGGGLERLAPQDLPAVERQRALERESGLGGDVNVVVRARDLAEPSVIAWMVRFQQRMLDRHGFSERQPCREAQLCPVLLLATVFGPGRIESRRQARALLDSLPPFFAQSLLSRDGRTASIAFSITPAAPDRERAVIDDLRRQVDPPPGVTAELAGAPVVEAAVIADADSSRKRLALGAVAAAFLVLMALYRRRGLAAVPLVPVLLATGWSPLILLLLGVTLSPMSAGLGVLVVVLSTELAVPLAAGYRAERAAGTDRMVALERSEREIGRALGVWTVVALAGIAALVTSDVRMLHEFGAAAVLDAAIVLLAVTLVLPAALAWAEDGVAIRLPRSRADFVTVARAVRTRATRVATALLGAVHRLRPALRQVLPRARKALRAVRATRRR